MIKRVGRFMESCHMVPEYKRLLVGFSGGADSLCLMEVLRELAPRYGLSLYAVHVHHGIRGESADQDAAFVEQYCRKHQIPYQICFVSARREACEQKIGLEEAGRNLRYRMFAQIGKAWGADAVAVAHHRNDQAETVLFQMARGSGLTGAGGIRPVQGGVIRPLLCVEKKEILAFLQERKLSWREDETNGDTAYTRNCIRQEILPLLESRVNEGSVAHIAALALQLQETESYLRSVEDGLWEKLACPRPEGTFIAEELLGEPELFHQRLIYRALEEQAKGRKDLTREHTRSVTALLKGPCGKSVSLPGGIKAWKEKGGVCIGRQAGDGREESVILTAPCSISFGERQLHMCIKPQNPAKIPENKYTKWFDYDKIKDNLVLRKRRPKDVICIDDAGHHKKLKDFMIDRKIPQYKRDSLWIVADGHSVVWIIGDRIGADYKVTERTERILEIKITGDRAYER